MSTVETFLNQDFDKKLLIRLLFERIEFRLKKTTDAKHPRGALYYTLINAPSDTVENGAASTIFLNAMACTDFRFDQDRTPPRLLAPASRITGDQGEKSVSIRDLALLDGDKFNLAQKDAAHPDEWDTSKGSLGIGKPDEVFVVRITKDARAPVLSNVLSKREDCNANSLMPAKIKTGSDSTLADAILAISAPAPTDAVPTPSSSLPVGNPRDVLKEALSTLTFQPWTGAPSAREPFSHGASTATITYRGNSFEFEVYLFFRSPEGVIRYLGKYLEAAATDPRNTYRLDANRAVFAISEKPTRAALVKTDVAGSAFLLDRARSQNPRYGRLVTDRGTRGSSEIRYRSTGHRAGTCPPVDFVRATSILWLYIRNCRDSKISNEQGVLFMSGKVHLDPTRRQLIEGVALAFGGFAAVTGFAAEQSNVTTSPGRKMVRLSTPNSATNICIDLSKVKATGDQRAVLIRLFSEKSSCRISQK